MGSSREPARPSLSVESVWKAGVFPFAKSKLFSDPGFVKTGPCPRIQCRPKYPILTDYPSCFFRSGFLGDTLREKSAGCTPQSEPTILPQS